MSDNANLVGEDEFMLTKYAIAAVSGFGVSTIVRGGVEKVAPLSELSRIRKVPVILATMGIVGAVASIVDKSNNATIDEFVGTWRALKERDEAAETDVTD